MTNFFVEIRPAQHLLQYIKSYWYLSIDTGDSFFEERIIPDGCAEIIVHLGDSMSRQSISGQKFFDARSKLIGQPTEPYIITSEGKIQIFGIRFFPHTLNFFFKAPSNETINSFYGLDILGFDSKKQFEENINNCARPGEMATIADRFMTRRLRQINCSKFNYTDFAIKKIIASFGEIKIKEIEAMLRLSNKYLERIFLEWLGITPKTFAQIVRLQNILRKAGKKNSLTNLALDCGYFDQAHFIRNFRQYTGTSPLHYFKEQGLITKNFTNSSISSILYNS